MSKIKEWFKTFKRADNEMPIDTEFELYLEAWLIYHRTADRIDGHIHFPRNKDEAELCSKAAKAASSARNQFMDEKRIVINDRSKWNAAKLEAVRTVERERFYRENSSN